MTTFEEAVKAVRNGKKAYRHFIESIDGEVPAYLCVFGLRETEEYRFNYDSYLEKLMRDDFEANDWIIEDIAPIPPTDKSADILGGRKAMKSSPTLNAGLTTLPELEPIMICPTCHDLYGGSYWNECCNDCCTLEHKKGVKLEPFYGTTQLNKYKRAIAERLKEIDKAFPSMSASEEYFLIKMELRKLISELDFDKSVKGEKKE